MQKSSGKISHYLDELISWRHDIHKHPELGFNEHRTAKKIAGLLESFGLEVSTGIGNTGVVGTLTKGSSNRMIGLRADMDALPIEEKANVIYRSINDHIFHGCGHDGHSIMLLGAAKYLAEHGVFDGTVAFIFQPDEENGRGALAMIEDGLFERFPMRAVYGMHNMPGIPLGHFAVRSGAMMTFEDNFCIQIRGRGGHASAPHKTIDPTVISAEIILSLQTISSRNISPTETAVVSVTQINTDGARNVIPSNLTIKGDIRGFSEQTRNTIRRRMEEIISGVCLSHGAGYSFDYSQEFIVLNNTATETASAIKAARAVVGENNVMENCLPATCSEDFAQMLKHKPGCYLLIGNGEDSQSLHHPCYDFADDNISIGADYWITLTEQLLPAEGST